jgi:hypothetical protein
MAIRNFAPSYCNTCKHFDLEKAAKERTAIWCPHREVMAEWDHRACVLYTSVNDNQRQARRLIVEQLHMDKQGRGKVEAKDAAESGQ